VNGVGHVVWLEDCCTAGPARVGGKAVGLGSLLQGGFQVPPGFAVTTDAYLEFAHRHRLLEGIRSALGGADGTDAQTRASEEIRAMFAVAELDEAVCGEIVEAYARLGSDVPVAVRSSATAEDLPDASFAGQQETYLWIRGGEAVARHVLHCWGSLFTTQAIAYRARLEVPLEQLAMGVVVQEMVPAEAAGVMMTIDPLTGDPSQICIEACYGLGLGVVGGEVNPDRFTVDKVTLGLRTREIAPKPKAYRWTDGGTVEFTDVPPPVRDEPCITDEEAIRLARLGKRVEQAHGCAQDVEWAIGPSSPGERSVHLLQTRPETVWSRRQRAPITTKRNVLDQILDTMSKPIRLR
jgi:phosphoenolpyruvate synthase/pyruvate phosphate dikinase